MSVKVPKAEAPPKTAYDGSEVAELKDTKTSASESDEKRVPLDTVAIQAAILDGSQPYVITLLDGQEIKMRTNFTVRDLMVKRLDSKLNVLMTVLFSETAGFAQAFSNVIGKPGVDEANMNVTMITNAMLASDKAQELILQIAAKLSDVDATVFYDNISGRSIAALGVAIIGIIGNDKELTKEIFPEAVAKGPK